MEKALARWVMITKMVVGKKVVSKLLVKGRDRWNVTSRPEWPS